MRIKFTRLLFFLFLVAISLRLFYWQVIKSDELSAWAEGQHFQDIKVTAQRGQIFFSDKFVLASTQPIFTMFGLPKTIKLEDKPKIALKLAQILTATDEAKEELKLKFLQQLSQDLYWVSLANNIDLRDKKQIEDLKILGLGFDLNSSRFYPEGSSSAHLLGFVGSNANGDKTGYFGLEGYYDGELKGLQGFLRHEKDALGLPIIIGNFFSNRAENGKDLNLYVDRTVQYIVEQYLKKGIEKYGAKSASVVVMDPKTGGVLAMASYPNYDPKNFADYPKEFYKNPVVAQSYEPGSTFKVLTMAAAINEDAVEADTKCNICSSPISMGGFVIKTWNNKYTPNITMTEGIIHSDNTVMVFTGKKLGLDKFYSYMENFGFGRPTDIDLQDETSPDLRAKDEWREIDLATASFGQGVAVTPIQMVRAVSAIANGGLLMEPHIVESIKDNNNTFEIKPKIVREVIKKDTAKIITEMMVKAVDEGEAKFAKPKGFRIAGKTGTAQIPIAGRYDPNKTIASFVGFAPADDPKFVMLVRYDQPTSSVYGSETAAPTFFEIAKELFTYYRIAPTEDAR